MRVRYLVSNFRLGQAAGGPQPTPNQAVVPPAPTPIPPVAPAPAAPVVEIPAAPQPRWVNEGKNDLTRTLLATATVAALAGLGFALFK